MICRNDLVYVEIEQFKDYELTLAIAFEMARRHYEQYAGEDIVIWHKVERGSKGKLRVVPDSHWHEKSEKLILKYYYKDFVDDWGIEGMEVPMNMIDKKRKFKQDVEKCKVEILHGPKCIDASKLFPKVSRPFPVIPIDKAPTVDIQLNLALPKEELLAYVEAIKDNYDKDRSAITFEKEITLLNEDEIGFSIRAPKGKASISILENSRQIVYADIFYIYDRIKEEGQSKENINDISHEIYVRHTELLEAFGLDRKTALSTPKRTPRTILAHYDLAFKMIDEMGYKELITGQKI
ncbi:hypothetical protein [Hydrogenimonas sp.]